jgi:hypothetical protein
MLIVGKAESIDRFNEYRYATRLSRIQACKQDVNREVSFEDAELGALMEELYRHNTFSTTTVDAIEHQAQVLSDRVCKRFTTLQNIVTRHESLIRKCWIKKTVAQRQDVLLKAWPGMPKDHLPDNGEYCIPYSKNRLDPLEANVANRASQLGRSI